MESFIFLASLLPLSRLSYWLETAVCGHTEYLLDEVLHLKEIAFRCWPAAFGQRCTCGSDLLILVQTEIWSSLTKYSWLLEEEFALCDCIDCLKHSGCASDFFWDSSFPAVRSRSRSASSRCCRNNFVATERGFFKWAVPVRRVLLIFLPLPELLGVLYRQPLITNVCLVAKVIPEFIWGSLGCEVP